MPNPDFSPKKRLHTGISFHNAPAFWAGTLLTIVGVLLHMPDYIMAADMGYRMIGMEMSMWMNVGMGAILLGMALATWGLMPRKETLGRLNKSAVEGVHFRAMDSAHLTGAHWGLLFVLGVALIIDVMKPATLGFVMPGTKEEYGLTTGQIALLPLSGLTGTTIGSIVWGILADKMGRRASILLASVMFIGTSICGFMPSWYWNLFMCFVMGLSAGGMLPIVYALMAESVPSKNRGWLVVLHGGMGTVGGYLLASGFAALLEPQFTWRILWFVGLPTGVILLFLNRWIPESPRYLLERGRVEEAKAVMARYGVVLERDDEVNSPVPAPVATNGREERVSQWGGLIRLFQMPYLPRTMTVFLYGLGWGLVNWGFLTFVPTFLADAGFARSTASGLLFLSSILAVPGTILVAYLYGMWSSKKSMILYAMATAATMVGFALLDTTVAAEVNLTMLTVLVVMLLVASGGVISMLSPYTAEVFPTHLRGSGSGLAAGSSKLGGILGPPLIAGLLAGTSSLAIPALVVAAPIAISAGVLALIGVETRGRTLEDITSDDAIPAPGAEAPGVL
ncbi:MAG: MFS transporter [Rhodothermaceae bacterium]|nr:MFS transporter [Rhodothermaceae bacterium]